MRDVGEAEAFLPDDRAVLGDGNRERRRMKGVDHLANPRAQRVERGRRGDGNLLRGGTGRGEGDRGGDREELNEEQTAAHHEPRVYGVSTSDSTSGRVQRVRGRAIDVHTE